MPVDVYYVQCYLADGDASVFVVAPSPREAVALWRAWARKTFASAYYPRACVTAYRLPEPDGPAGVREWNALPELWEEWDEPDAEFALVESADGA